MRHARLFAATALLVVMGVSAPASAQIFGGGRQDRQIEALQRDVTAIQQRLDGAPGQPGVSQALTTLQDEGRRSSARIDDLEQALRTLNGTVETLSTELAAARRSLAGSEERNQELAERLRRSEAAQTDLRRQLDRAAAQTPAPQPSDEDEPETPAPRPAAEAPRGPDAQWAAARAAAQGGDYAAAEALWQTFISSNPREPRLAEAQHNLGEARYMREDWQGAAAAYATSLRGWPSGGWAAESTLKLAAALGRLNRTQQACQALAEFDRRYAPAASARGRQRAAQSRRDLSCPAT